LNIAVAVKAVLKIRDAKESFRAGF